MNNKTDSALLGILAWTGLEPLIQHQETKGEKKLTL